MIKTESRYHNVKRKNILKNVGIVLVVIQCLAIAGSIIEKDFSIYIVHNLGELISLLAFLMFGIVGALLIFLSYKRNKK